MIAATIVHVTILDFFITIHNLFRMAVPSFVIRRYLIISQNRMYCTKEGQSRQVLFFVNDLHITKTHLLTLIIPVVQ